MIESERAIKVKIYVPIRAIYTSNCRIFAVKDRWTSSLSEFLPSFMVKNAKVYSILSRGVHELSEQDCLTHFAVVKGAIDLILDQLLAEEESNLKKSEIEKALARISSSITADD